jgi:hypothetical protein
VLGADLTLPAAPRLHRVEKASVGSGTFEAVEMFEGRQPGALNKYSSVITQQKKQGAGQSQLYGTGMDDVQPVQHALK